MQKISIRLEADSMAKLDSFAVSHGMSRAATTEFFVKLGIRELTKIDGQNEVLEELLSLKKILASMHETLYRSSTYLALNGQQDTDRFEKAKAAADKSKREIFGDDQAI